MTPPDDLEAAARRRRDREASRAAAAGAKSAKEASERPGRKRRMQIEQTLEALAEAGWRGKLFTGAGLGIGMFGPLVLGVLWLNTDALLAILGVAIVSMVGAFAGYDASERLLGAVRRRRLFSIGRGFDPPSYLEALGHKRRRGVVVVRVRFAKPWPDDARASSRDAVLEWMPSLAQIEWEGSTLVLRSAELDGREYLSGGRYSSSSHVFNNRLYHGCFMQVVDDVVPHLEQVAPIESLDVTIDGTVEAWDADADRF